jgi:DNA-directed RNA polymerase subunit alpha
MNVDLMVRTWQTLIRPRRIDIEDNLSPTYGRFECAPLERGFGLTLGNALRRVLLSSLQGSAITSVRIEGVQHEFSSIPGVLEDVTDVVLNLKEVRLRSHSAEPKQIVIKKSGGGAVTASDFQSPDQTWRSSRPPPRRDTLR